MGGLAAGITWAALGKVFTGMVVYTSRLELVYAGFALVVAVFLWTYLGSVVVLMLFRAMGFGASRQPVRKGARRPVAR